MATTETKTAEEVLEKYGEFLATYSVSTVELASMKKPHTKDESSTHQIVISLLC